MEITTIVILTVFITLNVIILFGYLGLALAIGKQMKSSDEMGKRLDNVENALTEVAKVQNEMVEPISKIQAIINQFCNHETAEIKHQFNINNEG